MAEIHIFTFNLFREHTMTMTADGKRCVVVDPGFCSPVERNEFFGYLEEHGLTPEAILTTHFHVDHIWGAKELQDRYGIPMYIGNESPKMVKIFEKMAVRLGIKVPDISFKATYVSDGDVISAAGMEFKVIATPGHSPEGVCYLEEKERTMFTGDTLFAGTIGRSDLEGGEYDDLIRSIMEKLIWLDPDITIYPGHGPSSTIGVERTSNPFLEPFNEPEEDASTEADLR